MSALFAIVVILGLSLALTRRVWAGVGLTAYLVATILLASWIKQSHQGMAMTLGDVHFFLVHPVLNFKVFVEYPSILATTVAVLGVGVAIVLAGMKFERPRLGGAARAVTAVVAVVIGVVGFM